MLKVAKINNEASSVTLYTFQLNYSKYCMFYIEARRANDDCNYNVNDSKPYMRATSTARAFSIVVTPKLK